MAKTALANLKLIKGYFHLSSLIHQLVVLNWEANLDCVLKTILCVVHTLTLTF